MKNYDYWANDWPVIVAHAFAVGAAIYECVTVRDDAGKPLRYERGRRLDHDEALAFRGETITVYEPTTQTVMEI